ncbi:MAG: TlpA disulfide reductase family protein [Chitinophagales bacterium]
MKTNIKNTVMKNIALIVVLISITTSCKHFNGYSIDGTIKNGDGVKVSLEDITTETPTVLDTITIRNRAFKLKNYSSKGIYRLRFGDDATRSIFLYIAPNDHIVLDGDYKQLEDYTVKGNKGSISIQQLVSISKARFTLLDSSYSKLRAATPAQKDSLLKIFTSEKKAYVDYIKDFINKEKNTDVACFALNYLGPMLQEEIPYLVDEIEKLHKSDPESKYIDGWYKQMKQYRDAMLQENEGGVALNAQAPNIILQSPGGDTIQLKNLQGNYVLLDFWASWCNPCRMENPNVVALYKKYHDKGFEVFSVSLDANAEQWKKAIAKDGLIWKNHGCDFGGWNSAPAQQYHIESIPSTYLLDKTGKVIAKNLRGEALAAKLAELFPQQAIQ